MEQGINKEELTKIQWEELLGYLFYVLETCDELLETAVVQEEGKEPDEAALDLAAGLTLSVPVLTALLIRDLANPDKYLIFGFDRLLLLKKWLDVAAQQEEEQEDDE